MLKDNVLFVGVGQGGGNQVREFEKLGYNVFYINTSLEDLETLNTDPDNWHHIPKCKGMAKDRQLALDVLYSGDNINIITEKIYERFSNVKIVNYVFTTGGGTGGSMGIVLACDMAEAFPEKIVNVIPTVATDTEDMLIQYNSIKCLNQVKQAYEDGFVTSVYLLDNFKRDDKMKINTEFASLMDSLISFDSITKEGNLDSEEMERILTTRGLTCILEVKDSNFEDSLGDAYERSIFADWLKSSKVHGLILNKSQNCDTRKELVKEVFGIPQVTHDTVWEKASNIIVSAGMKFNEAIINRLKKRYNELANKRKQLEEEANSQLCEENIEIAIDEIEDVSVRRTRRTSRRASGNQESETPSRRTSRRREGVSSTLDKFRNMK